MKQEWYDAPVDNADALLKARAILLDGPWRDENIFSAVVAESKILKARETPVCWNSESPREWVLHQLRINEGSKDPTARHDRSLWLEELLDEYK